MSQSSSIGERVGGETGPKSFGSVMTVIDLETLRSFCFIPDEFRLVLATSGERVHVPPVGCIGVYEEAVKAGLRFFLHPFVKRVMERFFLSLAQVAPNSWHYIVRFVCLCRMLSRPPTLGLFWTCFSLKRHPHGGGWWYFSPRSQRRIVLGVPSFIMDGRSSFSL